jgi:hypothetical protein
VIRVFEGTLPRALFRAVVNEARPRSAGWTPLDRAPRSAVEQAIHGLRRLAGRCAGAEWWFNRDALRPFHYDKDEKLFARTRRMVHPRRASILYLGDGGGPTVILNETPTSIRRGRKDRPISGVRVEPRANRFVLFTGDRFHAAYPGRGSRATLAINWWDRRPRGVAERSGADRPVPRAVRPRRVRPAPIRMAPFGGVYVMDWKRSVS